MSYLGITLNEYGTKVSEHRCVACGSYFTVCPMVDSNNDGWNGCLAETCASYDITRDIDLLWDHVDIRAGALTEEGR